MADQQENTGNNPFELKRLNQSYQQWSELSSEELKIIKQFLGVFSLSSSQIRQYENWYIYVPKLHILSADRLVFTTQKRTKTDWSNHLYVGDVISICRDLEKLANQGTTYSRNLLSKYQIQPNSSRILDFIEQKRLINQDAFWGDLQRLASGLSSSLPFDKKAEDIKEKENEKQIEKQKEKLTAAAAAAGARTKQAKKQADQKEEQITSKDEDQASKLSLLSRHDQTLIDGFAQLTITASLATLGFEGIDFNSLSIEEQQKLLIIAREAVAGVFLSYQGELTSENRLKLLQQARKAFLLHPLGYQSLLRATQTYYQNLDANKKLEFKNNLDKDKIEQQEIAKEALENLAKSSDSAFEIPNTKNYQQRFVSLLTPFLTDQSKALIATDNITNTIDSFIINNYKPGFLLFLDANKFAIIFGEDINPAIFSDSNLRNKLISLLSNYWQLRKAALIAKNPNLAVDYAELDQETLNNPQELTRRLTPVSDTRKYFKKYSVATGEGGEKLAEFLNPKTGDREQEANKSLWQELSPEDKEFLWNTYVLDEIQRNKQDKRQAPTEFDFAEAQRLLIANELSQGLYQQSFAQVNQNGEMVFSAPPSSLYDDPNFSQNLESASQAVGAVGKRIGDFAAEQIGDLALKGVATALGAPGADEAVDKFLVSIGLGGVSKEIKQAAGYIVITLIIPTLTLILGGLAFLAKMAFSPGGLFGTGGVLGKGGGTWNRIFAKNPSAIVNKWVPSGADMGTKGFFKNVGQSLAKLGNNIGLAAPVASISIVALGTAMFYQQINSAFLANFPTYDVSQLTSITKQQSRYVDLSKTAKIIKGCAGSTNKCENPSFPLEVEYTIQIKPKEDYQIQIVSLQDVISVKHNKDEYGDNPPDVSPTTRYTEDFNIDYEEIINPGSSKTITYVETLDENYNHANIKNKLKMEFSYLNNNGSGIDEVYGGALVRLGNYPFADGCWPVSGTITQKPWGTFTHGVSDAFDIGVAVGTEVLAPFAGRLCDANLVNADGSKPYGNHNTLETTDGLTFLFAHLSSTTSSNGCVDVEPGDIIGMSGNTGASTGPHLHFEIRFSNSPPSRFYELWPESEFYSEDSFINSCMDQ
jgi:murein DD-endopeptidase MepM/ murein hydrolase activator NlpD